MCPVARCRRGLRRDPSGSALPTLPQSVSRGARFSRLHWFAFATACQVARPPGRIGPSFPGPPGAFTSRLPAGRSPLPPLDMTTTDGGMGPAWMSCAVRGAPPHRMEGRGRCAPAPSITERRTTMEHHAGLDVSLKETSVCIVDGAGKIIRETKVDSEPEALVGYFASLEIKVVRIGLEAGPLSQWLHAALTQAGFEVVLLETRHVKAALSAMTVKTDRRDARGIAQLLRMGWYRPVHCKTLPSQEVRAIITARKTLLGKLI